jgi:photosystem II stability/assembly factor-like uncharacterized protein
MTVRCYWSWLLVGCATALLARCGGERNGVAAAIEQPRFVPYQIGFWSAAHGIALNRSGRLMATSLDGGQTWRILRRWDGPVDSLSVASRGAVAVLGDCRRSVCRQMWRSHDDGRSWRGQVLPSPVSSLELARSSPGTAWSRIGAYETPCTGSRRPVASGLSGFSDPSALSMAADGRGLLAMDRAWSFRTSDGGRHWQPLRSITSPDTREALAVDQLSPDTALALVWSGDTGTTLYHTTDGGLHWSIVRRFSL